MSREYFIEVATISEVRGDKARVAVGSMVTDFLPVFQSFSNSFAVSFSPIRAGEQVLVLPVRGNLNSGVILRGLYQSAHKEEPTDKKVCVSFEDGVSMSYDTAASTLEIKSPKSINITCENANLNARNVMVTANDTVVKSPNIKLLGDTFIEGAINTAGTNRFTCKATAHTSATNSVRSIWLHNGRSSKTFTASRVSTMP